MWKFLCTVFQNHTKEFHIIHSSLHTSPDLLFFIYIHRHFSIESFRNFDDENNNESFCVCEHALAMMLIITGLLQNLANVITLKRILNLDIMI